MDLKPSQHSLLNHRLVITYDGSDFYGWQRQGKKSTVQLHLEHAISQCWKKKIIVYGSGRTDAGVHALGQVANFHAPEQFKDFSKLKKALNYYLPDKIRIIEAKKVAPDFHSRFSAKGKEYRYRIANHAPLSPFELGKVWHIPRALNLLAMKSAAQFLEGTHDFASFTSNPGYERQSTIRTLYRAEIKSHQGFITLTFRGNGFLYRMVRNLTGALVKIGQEKLPPQAIKSILKKKQRSKAPGTAPAHGLYLAKVFYRTINH